MKKTDKPIDSSRADRRKIIIITLIIILTTVVISTGMLIYRHIEKVREEQQIAADNDSLIKNATYRLAMNTFHENAVDDVDDSAGEDVADWIADLGMRVVDDIGKRPPSVEVTDENCSTIATVESVLISEKDTSRVCVSVTSEVFPLSDDGYYYLFSIPVYENSISGEPIDKAYKNTDFTISCNLNYNSASSRLFNKFCVALKINGRYKQVSNAMYITNPYERASYSSDRTGAGSKKGLLVDPVLLNSGELTDLGVKHAAYNVYTGLILGQTTNAAYPTITYTYNGESYNFNGEAISMYDTVFSSLTNQGIDVNAILINNNNYSDITYPASRGASATLYAFNTTDKQGTNLLAATCSFLAERYSGGKGHGKVLNWIIGNEVNEREIYNYMPYMGIDEYAKQYANVVRVCYNSFLAVNKNMRVFVSFDQRWNMNKSDDSFYDVRDMLDWFNSIIVNEGNFNWNMGFHPYNYPLTESKAWDLGKYSKYVTNSVDTSCICIKNINILTDYLCMDEFLNADGNVRHIVLSEMGYTSYFGQQNQAASYAYAYKIMENNEYIDYMLMSRQTDASEEAADKLCTGINTSGYQKKEIYNVFKYCGTSSESEYIDKYLSVIGISSWSEAGYH